MNNVSVEKLENNKVKLKIEVSNEKFEEGMNKAYFKNAKHFNIPGFRKGKAPRSVVERYYGEGVLYEEAFNSIAPDIYDEAIKENNLEVVSNPEIDIEQIGCGKNLIFTAVVDVKPEVKIDDYKGIEVAKKEYTVTDENIDHEIGHMLEKNARLISVEDRPLASKDIATIDFEGFVDGVAFPGGKAENYELEIGSGSFIAGFEEQLIGMEINEDKEINVTFPEEYFSKELAGKPATFKVKLHSIKMNEFPKLDDEFAKDVSEFDTLDELKADIKAKLEHENEHRAEDEMNDELSLKLIDKAVVEVPKSMIDTQIDKMVKDFEWNLKYKGMDLEGYLKYIDKTLDQFKEQFKEQAEKIVKLELILEEVSKKENIEVTEKELDEKVEMLAREYSKDEKDIKDMKERILSASKKDIEYRAKIEKTLNWLYDNAKIK